MTAAAPHRFDDQAPERADVQVRPKRNKMRACDACAKKKIKCDGSPPCSNCVNYKTQCVFTYVEKQRKTPQRSARRIAALEDRLGQVEASLARSGLFPNQKLPSNGITAHPEQSGDRADDDPSVISMEGAPGLAKNAIASSATSPSGQAAHTDKEAAAAYIDNDWTSDHEKLWLFVGSNQQRMDLLLPPRHEAISLVQEFFDKFNCVFPLFHQSSFMRLIETHYTRNRGKYPEFWAALNVALALSYRFRAMSSTIPLNEDAQAWGYLQNALQVVPELILRNPHLLGVQAILGMAVILQGTPNPQPASTLVATAIRMSHHLGLHNSAHELGSSSVEKEHRVRVFWFAYILDKDFSLRLSQPPLLYDDDLKINLPSKQPEDGLGYIQSNDGSSTINLFRMRVLLAIIEGRIYSKLYSSRAQTQSPQERSQAVKQLELMLDDWKHNIPFEFRSDSLAQSLAKSNILHMVILHLCYFNCLTMLHGVSLQNTKWTTGVLKYSLQGSDADLSNPAHAICVSAARASMRLIHLIPRGNYACIWLLLCYYVSGLVILLANILHGPQDSSTRTDMQLIEPLLRLLDSLQGYTNSTDLRRMRAICTDLERRAMVAMDTFNVEDPSRLKRKRNQTGDVAADQETVRDELMSEWLKLGPSELANLPEESQENYLFGHELSVEDGFVAEAANPLGWQHHISEAAIAGVPPVPEDLYGLNDLDNFSSANAAYHQTQTNWAWQDTETVDQGADGWVLQ